MPTHHLLICSLGGAPEPVVASLVSWRPARVIFLTSAQTASDVGAKVLPLAQNAGLEVLAGASDVLSVSDAQDLKLCIETWRPLAEQVANWLARGESYAVVVDFTGGTKCMTAALALLAHRWRCLFSYIGGTERTKDGVGVVISGREQVRHAINPWNALGYATVEDAVLLFDRGQYAASAGHLDEAMRKVSEPGTRRELATLKMLADAYAAWDRFDHRSARSHLANVVKNANDLLAVFGHRAHRSLMEHVARSQAALAALIDADTQRDRTIPDLLANADRRAAEGRYDDSVARIYRAVEALAQNRLKAAYGVETHAVPLGALSDELRAKAASFSNAGAVKLGLQDAYALLRHYGDPLGQRFEDLGWHILEGSPLIARNQSILAHGFAPVSEANFRTLMQGALHLAGLEAKDIPCFPRLGGGS